MTPLPLRIYQVASEIRNASNYLDELYNLSDGYGYQHYIYERILPDTKDFVEQCGYSVPEPDNTSLEISYNDYIISVNSLLTELRNSKYGKEIIARVVELLKIFIYTLERLKIGNLGFDIYVLYLEIMDEKNFFKNAKRLCCDTSFCLTKSQLGKHIKKIKKVRGYMKGHYLDWFRLEMIPNITINKVNRLCYDLQNSKLESEFIRDNLKMLYLIRNCLILLKHEPIRCKKRAA